jgi:hypothetical protein
VAASCLPLRSSLFAAMAVEIDGICNTVNVMNRDDMLNVRIPAEIKAAVTRAADEDHGRSMSGMVVRILTEWLTERGHLPAPGKRTKKGKP